MFVITERTAYRLDCKQDTCQVYSENRPIATIEIVACELESGLELWTTLAASPKAAVRRLVEGNKT